MFRKIIRHGITTLPVTAGSILILGSAGSIDNNLIPFNEGSTMLLIGLALFIFGAKVFLWLCKER